MIMTKEQKERVIGITMVVFALILTICASFTGFAVDCEEMPESVIRLHILANSDSEADQDLKYRLRDYIMEYMDELLRESGSLSESERIVSENIGQITQKSQEFIKTLGYGYNVNAEVCEMYFTTRVYENITMPAGDYTALRIIIGEGEGQNWWCVIFPPLCLPACTNGENDLYISREMSKVIEQGTKTEYKFAVYEWLRNLMVKK